VYVFRKNRKLWLGLMIELRRGRWKNGKYLNEISDLKTVFHDEIKVKFHKSVSLKVSGKVYRKSQPPLGEGSV